MVFELRNHFDILFSKFEVLEIDYLTKETDNNTAYNNISNYIDCSIPCFNEYVEQMDINSIYKIIINIIKFCYYLNLNVDDIVYFINKIGNNVDKSFIDLSDDIQYELKCIKKSIFKHPEDNVYNIIIGKISFIIPILETLIRVIKYGFQIKDNYFPELFKEYITGEELNF